MIDVWMFAAVLGANLLGGAMAVPQVAALYRSRNVAGISAAWAGASAAVNAWWAAYGLGVGDIAIIPVSAFSVTIYLLIVVGVFRFVDSADSTPWQQLATGLSVALIPLPVTLTMGWAWTGITLGVLYAFQLSPAVITVYRANDVSGVAAGTWALCWLEAVLWGVYALPMREIGLLTLAGTGLFMSSLVLARLYVKRPRRDRSSAVLIAR